MEGVNRPQCNLGTGFINTPAVPCQEKNARKENYFYASAELWKYLSPTLSSETKPALDMLTSAYGHTLVISASGAETSWPSSDRLLTAMK